MEQAIIFFNGKPNKGIKFCIEQKFFPEKPENVVNFLLNANGLSKFAIGQYLACPDNFNQQVLENFARRFNYQNESIDESLRKFLKAFRLPGEGDQIDRVIDKFANAYKQQNPQYEDTKERKD